jgi:hypothetical protein
VEEIVKEFGGGEVVYADNGNFLSEITVIKTQVLLDANKEVSLANAEKFGYLLPIFVSLQHSTL